jgi:3-phenylpropionate/trans-cinnamate dioxygenase ferredoxin reductase subunit
MDNMGNHVKYLIVGGGLAANAAVLSIRDHDADNPVALFTDEPHRPYDRVPLSKKYLSGATHKIPYLRSSRYYEQRGIEIRTNCRVQRIDAENRVVHCCDGSSVSFDKLLLATGGKARKLNIPGNDLEGVCYLRTIEDADRIREYVKNASRAVVVGGGFIGCEVAAALAAHGTEVYMVEVMPYLLYHALDKTAADWITKRLERAGVHVLTDTQVTEFKGTGRISKVTFQDGSHLDCDLAVVGVGIVPNTELAEEAGLRLENGIWVDEFLETSVNGIFAAGDVACYRSLLYGENLRVEHWDTAIQQGRTAGLNMVGLREPFNVVPYFFSTFTDVNVTGVGKVKGWDHCVSLGEPGHPCGLVQLFFSNKKLIGLLGLNVDEAVLEAAVPIIQSGQVVEYPDKLATEGELFEIWKHNEQIENDIFGRTDYLIN